MIAVAAMLWGTDGIFRTILINAMPNSWAIVSWEHIILVVATGWLLWRDRAQLTKLDRRDWPDALTSPFNAFGGQADTLTGVLMTLGAAGFWGSGTVFGRRLLGKLEFPTLTSLRFAGALPVLLVIAALNGFVSPGVAQLPALF